MKLPNHLVIDTNVAVCANYGTWERNEDHFPPEGIEACVDAIEHVTKSGVLVIDDQWKIIGEYLQNLHSSGEPGIGDHFLKWVLTNYKNSEVCQCVSMTRAHDGSDIQFPVHGNLETFDPSDKKFVLVSLSHISHPAILQAKDSKWWGWAPALNEVGVKVIFMCPKYCEEKYPSKINVTKRSLLRK